MKAFLKEVADLREAPRVIEQAPVGDSQANGAAERAVRSVEEIVRVHKLALEKKVGKLLPVGLPIFAWLVEFCVDVLNKVQKGPDGKTAFERVRGRRYGGELLAFATPVFFRVAGKVAGGLMRERWFEGTYLGQRFSSNEHYVAAAGTGKVFRTRSA